MPLNASSFSGGTEFGGLGVRVGNGWDQGLQQPSKICDHQFGHGQADLLKQIKFSILQMLHPGRILNKNPKHILAEIGRSGQAGDLFAGNVRPMFHQVKEMPLAGPLFFWHKDRKTTPSER